MVACTSLTGAEPQVEFPPAIGPYSGDYVYISEPGRYTLEQNVTHTYPIGVIIAAPSVVLDGQGYSIQPAGADPSSVGIWIRLTDLSGNPVTGVTIRNVSIEGEGHGLYSEGIDSSIFAWGQDHSADPDAIQAVETTRNLTLSELISTSCHEGVSLTNLSDTKIVASTISDCTGSGITVTGGRVDIQDSTILNNLESGILLSKSSGSGISSSVIEGNRQAGITLKEVNGVQILNNQFHNTQNIETDNQSTNVVISPTLETGDQQITTQTQEPEAWNRSDILSPVQGIDNKTILKTEWENRTSLITGIPDLTPAESPTPVPTVLPVVTISPDTTPVETTPKTIMTGIHAVISGDSIPKEMKAGSTYPVDLILFNDGSDDWIPQYQIGVMALEETADYGPAWIGVPEGTMVRSGQSQTLSFDLRAPSKPGIYTLKYQAARQGTGLQVLFGRAYTKTVTVA